MAEKRLPVQLLIRNATASAWETRNPTLEQGEFGLENDTFLIKIGDGVRDWEHLPYLNKLNARYFKTNPDGTITFSDWFATNIENLITAGGGSGGTFIIENDPQNPTDPVNYDFLQRFIADAIAHANHLKREVVQTLPVENIDENTLYMMLAQSGDHYEEYMYINGAWDMVGTTGDGGNSGSGGYTLPVATVARLGGVKASTNPDRINVTQEGFMTLNQVSTSLLYVPDGDVLVIYGGTA